MFCASLYAAMKVSGWHFGLPVAMAGSNLAQQGGLFNALGFIVPGALMAAHAVWSRFRLAPDARPGLRFALWLWAISAAMLVLMGLFPLNLALPLDEGGNTRHAAAWYLWWSSAVLGCVAALFSGESTLRLFAGVALIEILLGVWVLPSYMPVGAAQAFAMLAWMVWPFSRRIRPVRRAQGTVV